MNKGHLHSCFICGANSTYSVLPNSEIIHLFHIPPKSFVQWKTIITRPGFNESSFVCNRHFPENHYTKGSVDVISKKKKYWKLNRNAIPSLLLGNILQNFIKIITIK